MTASAASGESAWHQAGYRDAMAGKAVRDNDTLTEWYGTPHVDREDYLSGYTAVQADLCRAATLRAWGEKGRNFPASCDGIANAEQLRQQWQTGMDRASR
ncbi:DUF2799 domain-containing protein [Candidatus Sodalis endolongispinus]|uniref:DUF2799 domain-containing protein n=2 Tax=Candidatus Sodalis endolongispinus TaxID=2812662 RepID=A0ABS5Y9H9_9GAMM|nr:DUF2799 domain-containing protein [Candidatus Sodalis endolongispinus]